MSSIIDVCRLKLIDFQTTFFTFIIYILRNKEQVKRVKNIYSEEHSYNIRTDELYFIFVINDILIDDGQFNFSIEQTKIEMKLNCGTRELKLKVRTFGDISFLTDPNLSDEELIKCVSKLKNEYSNRFYSNLIYDFYDFKIFSQFLKDFAEMRESVMTIMAKILEQYHEISDLSNNEED